MVEHYLLEIGVVGSNPIATQNSKGSSFKTQGSKVQKNQGCKRQGSKDVTQGVVASERPWESYVSSFTNPDFQGFLFGRVLV